MKQAIAQILTAAVITVVTLVVLKVDFVGKPLSPEPDPQPVVLPIVGSPTPIINDQATELATALGQLKEAQQERDQAREGWRQAEALYRHYETYGCEPGTKTKRIEAGKSPVAPAPQPPSSDSLPVSGGGVRRRRG